MYVCMYFNSIHTGKESYVHDHNCLYQFKKEDEASLTSSGRLLVFLLSALTCHNHGGVQEMSGKRSFCRRSYSGHDDWFQPHPPLRPSLHDIYFTSPMAQYSTHASSMHHVHLHACILCDMHIYAYQITSMLV